MTKQSPPGGTLTTKYLYTGLLGKFLQIEILYSKGKISFTTYNTSDDTSQSTQLPTSIRCLHIICSFRGRPRAWIICLPSIALTTYIGRMMVTSGIQST